MRISDWSSDVCSSDLHDIAKLIHHLRQGLHWNVGNIGSAQLYARARVGTKQLVTDYTREVASALQWICAMELAELPHAAQLKFFQEIALSFGRSALIDRQSVV